MSRFAFHFGLKPFEWWTLDLLDGYMLMLAIDAMPHHGWASP